jgi:hypothetical protein
MSAAKFCGVLRQTFVVQRGSIAHARSAPSGMMQ